MFSEPCKIENFTKNIYLKKQGESEKLFFSNNRTIVSWMQR